MEAQDIIWRFHQVRQKMRDRDIRNDQVASVRAGKISEVAPELFPTSGPWQEPIIANLIDVAARDMAEMIAPLPSFNCSSPSMVSNSAKERATKKTKVALGISTHSNLQVQMYTSADQYVTFGSLPVRVEVDYDMKMPFIRCLDPRNTYAVRDRWGRVVEFYQLISVSRQELIAQYPEHRMKINDLREEGNVQVLLFHDKDADVAILLHDKAGTKLGSVPNPIGKVMVSVAERPGSSDIPRGQFDDVIFVQLARARFMLLSLQIATEAANAPLVVPSDVPDIPMGPGATIRTNNPAGVGKVKWEVPRDVFTEAAQLERELQQGSRFPSVRSGNSDASIVTGKGVQALMGGYDSQVRGHQAIFAATLQEAMATAFEVDEKVFKGHKKRLRATANGTPFSIEYEPSSVIGGDYSVDVAYGLMAGLDPNRWLVFGLQARAEKLFSRDFMRREMPVDIDAEAEAQKVDLEDLEESAKQAIQGYAQAIPALASQGQDPGPVVAALARVIELRQKGKSISEAVVDAFTPKPPPEVEAPAEQVAEGGVEEPGDPNDPGQRASGLTADGRMDGVAAGQQGEMAGGRPDLKMMLAGLDSRGGPNLQATVSRQKAF